MNGEQVQRRVLRPGDIIQFGSREGPQLRFAALGDVQKCNAIKHPDATARNQCEAPDLEALRWFCRLPGELNSAGQVDRVLASLLETTLTLARVDRLVMCFSMGAGGGARTRAGQERERKCAHRCPHRIAHGDTPAPTSGNDQFIVTDNLSAEGVPESIVVHDIHTIICIPLRRTRKTRHGDTDTYADDHQGIGALSLDQARLQLGGLFPPEDHEADEDIAREAAALMDNAQLAIIEDQRGRQEEELKIEARIQQELMAVQIPAFILCRLCAGAQYSLQRRRRGFLQCSLR